LTVFHSWKGTAVKRMLGVQQDLKESRGNAVEISAQCGEGGSKQTDWPGIHSLE